MPTKLRTDWGFQILKYLLLGVFAVILLFPIYSLVLASFRPGRDLMRYGISFTTLVPGIMDPKNFVGLVTDHGGRYLTWYWNSLALTALQTAASLGFSSLVGYGLGAYDFRGKNLVMGLVLFVMMIPVQILILPLYNLMVGMGTMNTYWGVILPFAVSPFAIFFFRQYVVNVPKDYMDAGRIDGLGEFAIYFKIITPLMAPAFGAMAILTAQQSWNSFLWPLIIMRTEEMFTLPIGLNSLLTPYGNNYEVLIAGSCMASVPLILLFIIFQRFFISGLSSGGIKG